MADQLKILTEVAEAAAAFKAHAVYLHPESTEQQQNNFIRDRSRLSEALCKWRMSRKKAKHEK